MAAYRPGEEIDLWPGGQPVAARAGGHEYYQQGHLFNVRRAAIYPFLVDRRPAPAVLVFPGGGYQKLSMINEGERAAEWLNRLGVHAFVVKTRLVQFGAPAPLLDAWAAICWVRGRAQRLGVVADSIGVLGFSAGGHLAACLGQFHDEFHGQVLGTGFETINARPDFTLLVYPVITLRAPHAHTGSREALLGCEPDRKDVARWSIEPPLRADTPPAFIVHSAADASVPAENSLLYWQGLRAHRLPAELLLYQQGGHGFGLHDPGNAIGEWPERAAHWLAANRWWCAT